MSTSKRRSDRIMLTVRLRIPGTDAAGKHFKEDARAVTVNRHGASIRTSVALEAGQNMRLIILAGDSDAEFRVVGPLAPPAEASCRGVPEPGLQYLGHQVSSAEGLLSRAQVMQRASILKRPPTWCAPSPRRGLTGKSIASVTGLTEVRNESTRTGIGSL